MKNSLSTIIYLFFISFLFFNCSTHFIGTWDNYGNEGIVDDSGNFQVKNDTLGISHAFNSTTGKIQVRMENYTDQPLLINMTKSTMTVNGRAMGFVDGNSTMYGNLDQNFAGGVNAFTFRGVVESNPNSIIIPPNSYAESTSVNILREKRNLLGQKFDEKETYYPLFDYPTPMQIRFYNESNSPIKLTSYVNYSILDKEYVPITTNTITQNYFISSYAKITNMSIKQVNKRLLSRDDVSGYFELKGTGAVLLLLLGAIVATAIIAEGESEE
ncbi:hypothetical protein ACFOUP_07545 [Belliella kenyensis]|uniref:Lipoprotein n=1 Tax=Belliella kenyensis TaxID=1472724 RepID=A0ABV8EKQ3_9BACT|nr:hypothetical protein [Belliella kenyensis]MCH7400327.1 hypothetical protein [Belliella kenyensis]MDN3604655.1 hypothetical protein [Belliella kenyensis]